MFGGTLSFNVASDKVRFNLKFSENRIFSNVASLKGGIFYFNITRGIHTYESFLEMFMFLFLNNSISNNWAPQGLVAYIDGINIIKNPDILLNLVKMKLFSFSFSDKSNLIVSSATSLKFWDYSNDSLTNYYEVKDKVFSGV